MVLIGGLLLGLAQGMIGSFKQYYSADLFITPSTEKSIIEQTQDITSAVETIPNQRQRRYPRQYFFIAAPDSCGARPAAAGPAGGHAP